MRRRLAALAVALAWLHAGGAAQGGEPARGIAVDPADVAELARVHDAGADVAYVRLRAADLETGAALATGRAARDADLPVVVLLAGPRGASPASWRAFATGAEEELGGAGVEVRAWVVRSASRGRVRAVSDGLGAEATILAMIRGRSAWTRRSPGADGVMFDPRARTPADVIRRARRLRGSLPAASALWIGPIGWSSQRRGADGWAAGLRGQRAKLSNALRGLAAGSLGVDGVVWSRWRDRDGAHGFGLVRRDGRAKPSLRAFRRITGGGSGDGGEITEAPDPLLGVAPAEPPTDADLDAMSRAGVEVLRFTVSREVVDPDHDEIYDWSSVDHEFAGAARLGAEPLPTLIDAPQFGGRITEPGELAGWGRFVAAAVARYGAGGGLWSSRPGPTAIAARWQVWNEQNAPAFWRPRPAPADYAELLAVSARRIREADPAAQVMLGGMFGDPLNERGIDADAYLEALYDTAGAAADFDAIAAHPYAGDLAGVVAQLDALRTVAVEAGDEDVALWVTELGWSSVPDPRPQWAAYSRTPEGQAEMLTSVGRLLLAGAPAWNLRGFVWYTWRDPSASVCPFCLNAGLLEADGTPKPALSSFGALSSGAP